MINLIYFVAAITCTVCFKHPIFLTIGYFCAFVYSVKLGGWKMFLLNLAFLLLAFGYAARYASYEHFGVTVLAVNMIDNQITLESLVYGLVNGFIFATVCMWCCCIFMLITADKIVYLFGRISPKLSLFVSILLRTVPRVKVRAKRIEISREGIGKGIVQGNLWEKFLHLLSLISILITWTMEDFVESSNSMKSRGYSLRGRTAFSIYRFDNRDRSLVVVFFWCLTVIGMGVLLNQTTMYFDPMLIMNPITTLSYIFYAAYALFLLLPMGLQIVGEYRFDKLRTSIED
jgi:energy-coupling factor transport system permease protein